MVVLAAALGCALPHTSHLPSLQLGQACDGKEVGTAHPPHNQPHLSIPVMFKALLGAVHLELSVGSHAVLAKKQLQGFARS